MRTRWTAHRTSANVVEKVTHKKTESIKRAFLLTTSAPRDAAAATAAASATDKVTQGRCRDVASSESIVAFSSIHRVDFSCWGFNDRAPADSTIVCCH